MNRIRLGLLSITLLFPALLFAGQAKSRNWQTGTLVETEQSKVHEGSTTNYSTDGSAKQNGDKSNYSQNTKATTTNNYETYQTYTIHEGKITYVAREHLLFPWSKPVSATAGHPLKFAVEKGKMYLIGEDEKEHKATIVKVSTNGQGQSGQSQ